MKYADMHCDTVTRLYRKQEDLFENNCHIDIRKMQQGQCLLQNFAIFTKTDVQDSSFTHQAIDYYYEQLDKNRDAIRPVFRYEDILENEKKGYISAVLTLEDGGVIDDDLDNLNRYYERGVRMIALTWNFFNGIGYPNMDGSSHSLYKTDTEHGLTDFGIEYVKRMEELGIVVDVSHLSDRGFYDVLEHTTKPFVASHSNARSICGVARNLSDDMIRKLSKRGGVMGLNFCSAFIEDHNEKMTLIKDMVRHIDHVVEVGGIDCIGMGSDFDGIENDLEIKDASGMQLLYEALKDHYSEDNLEKIFYRNVLRVYKEVWK